MDRISLLPNDFLLQILSLLPTKDVLKTTLLSRRWRNLWKLVPKLEYIDCDRNAEQWKFLQFVDRSLLLNTAPVLESLHFKLDRQCRDVDIGFWIRIAGERGLRELNFEYCYIPNEPSRLPQSLYTCGTLAVLKLENVSLVDVKFPVCFQLLKTLHLVSVIFLDNESPQKIFSSCPVLEVLLVERTCDDNVTIFSLTVPSLQRFIYDGTSLNGSGKVVINTPSLKYLKTDDYGYKGMIEYMPEIVEASVEVTYCNTDDFLKSLTSLKRLLLCVPSESPFPTGKIFHQLVHLEFCTCEGEWHLLMSMIQHSPKLRSLMLNDIHDSYGDYDEILWGEPSSVPETLVLALETFEWRNYKGRKNERELATYILKHSRRLKIASFSPQVSKCTTLGVKYRMITQLARMPRGSAECELVFD